MKVKEKDSPEGGKIFICGLKRKAITSDIVINRFIEAINLSQEFNKIDTDEIDGLFWNDPDDGSQLPFEEIDESKIKSPPDENNTNANDDSTNSISKVLLKQLLGCKNQELYHSETPQLREKELPSKTSKEQNIQALFPTAPLVKHDGEVIKKSDKPMSKQDKNIQNIIERTKWKDDDVAELEKQMLAVQMDQDEESFQQLLPPLNDNSNYSTKNHQWNDVLSDDLQHIADSFVGGSEMVNDPNFPTIRPTRDPTLDLNTPNNAYNSRNFSSKYQPNTNSIKKNYENYAKGIYKLNLLLSSSYISVHAHHYI